MEERLRQVIGALRRLRVRQGDFMPVLEALIAQSTELARLSAQGPVHEAAVEMRTRAYEIHRIGKSVPKFVVEDLVNESIERLEASIHASTGGCQPGGANG